MQPVTLEELLMVGAAGCDVAVVIEGLDVLSGCDGGIPVDGDLAAILADEGSAAHLIVGSPPDTIGIVAGVGAGDGGLAVLQDRNDLIEQGLELIGAADIQRASERLCSLARKHSCAQ